MDALIMAHEPNEEQWEQFLSEAGDVELCNVGESFARDTADRRAKVIDCLAKFAESNDWNMRDSVARVLGAMRDRRVEPLLRRFLSDPEEGLVRYAALRGLRELEGVLNLDEIERLLKDSAPIVKGMAADILVSQGRMNPVLSLLESSDPVDRLVAAETLISAGLSNAAEHIVNIVKDADWTNRLWAIRVLRQTHDPKYLPIFESIRYDPEPIVRCEAEEAIELLTRD